MKYKYSMHDKRNKIIKSNVNIELRVVRRSLAYNS